MKKIVIWFLSATILAVIIAAGFFYYQSGNLFKTNNPIVSKLTNVDAENKPIENPIEEIPLTKLPSDVQLKDIIKEYPLELGTANDKVSIRTTSKDVIYKNKGDYPPRLDKIEIIANNKVIYEEKYNQNQDYIYYNKNSDIYIVSYFYSKYKILKGINNYYLAYYIEVPDPDTDGWPERYVVVNIQYHNQKFTTTQVNGYFRLNIKDDIFNPKISDNVYELVDNKYIISIFDNHEFDVIGYYEIINNNIKMADKELEIRYEPLDSEKEEQQIRLKEGGSVIIYKKADILSASKSIQISESTQIKLLGIKYNIDTKYNQDEDYNSMTHLIINGEEGWIPYIDLYHLGFRFPI